MKYSITHLVLACLVLMSAGFQASAARVLLSSSHRRLAQAGQLQLRFRSSGCDGIQLAVTARPSLRLDDPTAHGTVVIRNLNNISIPLEQVRVQVLNVAAVTPFYAYATCLNGTGFNIDAIPPSMGPTAFDAGTVTCTYRVNLPEASLAPGSTDQLSVQVTATIDTPSASNDTSSTSNDTTQASSTQEQQCTSDFIQIDTTFWTSRPVDTSSTSTTSTQSSTSSQSSTFSQSRAFFQSTTDDDDDDTTSDQTFTSQQGWHRRHSNGGGKGNSWFGGFGRRRLSQAAPIQLQTGQLGYVPTGCQGLTVTTNANQQQPGVISGTVVLTNPNTFDIPITTVQVILANDVGLEPLSTTAICPAAVVPANPQPYTVGELLCTFTFVLPNSGPVAGVPIWTAAKATATIAMSDAKCSSPVAVVSSVWPLGRRH